MTSLHRRPRPFVPRALDDDDVIVEEVLPQEEEEEESQVNLLSHREEVSSAKLQEIYDRKFAPEAWRTQSRPKSETASRTVDLAAARKSASAGGGERRRGVARGRGGVAGVEIDEDQIERLVTQMKSSKVFAYDEELGIRNVDDDDDDDSDEDENRNENQRQQRRQHDGDDDDDDGDDDDEDPLFGRRGRCPLQLLSEFIDALTLKDYVTALRLCEMILVFEPDNEIALEFMPNLREKIIIDAENPSSSESSGSESEGEEEEEEEEEEESESESEGY